MRPNTPVFRKKNRLVRFAKQTPSQRTFGQKNSNALRQLANAYNYFSGLIYQKILAQLKRPTIDLCPIKQPPMNTNKPANRYAELDALRGIAALMVVFFHFTMGRPEAAFGFRLGITGVDLFFVISGFVITMSIGRVGRAADFVINRASRLYPAYWAAATFTFALIIGRSLVVKGDLTAVNVAQYIANLTMFQLYFGIEDLDGSYWSLAAEMVFYISILLLFRFKQLKRINLICIGLITAAVVAQLFFFSRNLKLFLHGTTLVYLPLFLAGINFHKLYTGKENRATHYAIIVFCFVCEVLYFKNCLRARVFMSQTEYTFILAVIFGLFVLFVNGYLRFIVNRATLFLGKISYPLYLVHQFFSLYVLFPFLITYLHLNFWVAAFGITLPANLLIATIIAFYVDEPQSKKMKEFLRNLRMPRFEAAILKPVLNPRGGTAVEKIKYKTKKA